MILVCWSGLLCSATSVACLAMDRGAALCSSFISARACPLLILWEYSLGCCERPISHALLLLSRWIVNELLLWVHVSLLRLAADASLQGNSRCLRLAILPTSCSILRLHDLHSPYWTQALMLLTRLSSLFSAFRRLSWLWCLYFAHHSLWHFFKFLDTHRCHLSLIVLCNRTFWVSRFPLVFIRCEIWLPLIFRVSSFV